MMAGVTVRLKSADFSKGEGLAERGARAVRHAVASSLVAHADPLVPFVTGALKNSAQLSQGDWEQGVIRYGVHSTSYNYAARQYHDESLSHRDGRCAKWLVVAQRSNVESLRRVAQQAAREAVRLK